MVEWQEVKAKFEQFINRAEESPQIISRHGKPEVIVMSIEKYNELTQQEDDIAAFFCNPPLYSVNLSKKSSKENEKL